MFKAYYALILLTCSLLALLVAAHRIIVWDADGFQYTRIMLQDAGKSHSEALLIAESYYRTSPIGNIPFYAKFFAVSPQAAPPAPGPIFRPRILYPWLASLIYPVRGLQSLLDISGIAYIAAVLGIFWTLLAVARPWLAALGALIFALSPNILNLARAPLTDMLGIAFWTVALGCMLYLLRRSTPPLLIFFTVVCILMTLTRPLLFMPAGAALGVAIFGLLRKELPAWKTGSILLGLLVSIAVLDLVFMRAINAAGPTAAIVVVYNLALARGRVPTGQSIQSWYSHAVASLLVAEIKRSVKAVLPVIAVFSAIANFGAEIALLVGSATAGLLPIFLDPNSSDLARVVEAPMFPVVLASLVLGSERLLQSRLSATTKKVTGSATTLH